MSTYKLVRLKPFNPRYPSPRTYTILPCARFPRTLEFIEARGWYKVETAIADELEVEVLDGKRVFDVCTHQVAMALDREEELAKARRDQRQTAASPLDMRARPKAAEWAADPDFAPAAAPARKPPAPANFREWGDEDITAPRAPAAKPIERVAPRKTAPPAPAVTLELNFPSPDAAPDVDEEGETEIEGDWVAEAQAEEAATLPHPAETIGDEADEPAVAAVPETEVEAEPTPPPPAPEKPRGRGGRRR